MATRATSFVYDVETAVTFQPDHYSETAGLGLYYDANNWFYARLYKSESLGTTTTGRVFSWAGVWNTSSTRFPRATLVRTYTTSAVQQFSYRRNANEEWTVLVADIDVAYLSDEGVNGEPGEIGGFTGLFNFIGSVDAHPRQLC